MARLVRFSGAGDKLIQNVGFGVCQNLIQIWARLVPIWVSSGGVVYMWVMCPFCTRSEKHPHVGTQEKQGQRLAYTLPLDTVDL